MAVEELPELGIGTYENTDPEVCAESVATALNYGYRHVDTAEGYENERAVGEGIRQANVDREDVFLATKVSPDNLAYDDVIDHAEASRERLGVTTLDLLYVHWPIRAYDPEETLAAFDELHERGLVRNVGLSNFTPELLQEAIDVLEAPLFAHQVECHPLLQQERLREMAREDGHHLVAYTPLAKGDVTEIPELIEIAADHDATPAQVTLAWLLSKESVAAIPKSETPEHIRENYDALDVDLEASDIQTIDAITRERRYVDFEEAPWN